MRLIKRQISRAYGYFKLYGPRRFTWALIFKAKHYIGRVKGRLFKQEQFLMLNDSFKSNIPLPEGTLPFQTFLEKDGIQSSPNLQAQNFVRAPFVAIIADLSLPQCKKYRVLQKIESLRAIGIKCDYAEYRDLHRSLNLLQLASFVIFYRVTADQIFDVLKDECTRLKIQMAYDIDDPIFSKDIYSKNINLDFLTDFERENLLASTENFSAALIQCDHVILSTPRMVTEAKKMGAQSTFLWRNAVDQQTISAAQTHHQKPEKKPNGLVRIIYSSGSRAHEADFRIVESALLDVMNKYGHAQLHIVGYLELPDTFKKFGTRVTITPFGDYDDYIKHLIHADISIIPLVRDDFNDCKSAIRFYEASMAQTATIASDIGDFTNVIVNGNTGLLAQTADDWSKHLIFLLNDAQKRQEIAHAAHEAVQSYRRGETVVSELDDTLMHILKAEKQ